MRVILFISVAALACAQATAWREAERIFHADPQWLGSDGAFSIDLGNGRVLWSFGDTLVARKPTDTRKNAAFVRNTVAIMKGYDPTTAQMKFYWRKGSLLHSGLEIFPNEGKIWFWPAHGALVGDRLLVFCSRLTTNPDKKSLGFQGIGSTAFLIENPDAEPTAWKMRKLLNDDSKVTLGSAVVKRGEYLYIFCEEEPGHDIFLTRWKAADFTPLDWWNGEGWSDKSARRPVMGDVSSEISVQSDGRGGFVEINSQGFGGTDIVIRRAPKLEGPWSGPRIIYRPPEADWKDPFVYAGKAHPELKGGDLVITYAVNGKEEEVNRNPALYYPKFARMNWMDRR